MLQIQNLHASVEGAAKGGILRGLSLAIPAGQVHAVMGPNGSGKSTLAHVLAGKPGYEVTEGAVTYLGEDLLALDPSERAAKGVYLSFQYPVEIPGVATLTFLREALNAQRKARGEAEITAPEFLKKARAEAAALKIDPEMLKRPVNVGFSGGEKKRLEIFQARMLDPKLLILDETDSGLDIDALKVVADGVNGMRSPKNDPNGRAMLIITHYKRLLEHITPDRVHVLVRGRIVASGGPELADQLEAEGYDKYLTEAA